MSKKEKLTREQKKEKQRAEYEAMSQKEKEFFDYNKKWHTIGRIWNTIGILLIIAVPFVVCFSLKVTPNWTVFGNLGIWTLIIINLGSGISEPVIYAPMLGTNGEQPFQPENPLRRQSARNCGDRTRHRRKRTRVHDCDCDKLACNGANHCGYGAVPCGIALAAIH
ncbi:MAG: hypothetical protein KIC36_06555 [Clostridium sp.]|nr:hypothetical protein [Clostridium sp.]